MKNQNLNDKSETLGDYIPDTGHLAPLGNKRYIVFPNHLSSKQLEIECIEKIAESVGPGSYLGDLFSKQMVQYVIDTIKGDHSPNLFDAYTFTLERLNDLESMYDQKCADLTKSNGLVVQMQQAIETSDNNHKDEIHSMTVEMGILRNSNYQLQTDLDIARELISDQAGTIDDLNAEIGAMEYRLVALKAKLYDFEHPTDEI